MLYRLRAGINVGAHFPSDTRSQIVRAAGDLFHSRGIRSTTSDEIVQAARIAKADLRQYFRCKPDLVSAVLRSYFEGIAAGVGPVKYALDSWDDLEQCLASHLEFQKRFKMRRGCPVGVLGSELKEGDETTRQGLTLILDLMLARLGSFFSQEKMAGRLSNTADVEQLANFCVATVQGAILTGKVKRDSHYVEAVFKDLVSHLKRYAKSPTAARKGSDRNKAVEQQPTSRSRARATGLLGLRRAPNGKSPTDGSPVQRGGHGDEEAIGSNAGVVTPDYDVCDGSQNTHSRSAE